MQSTQVSTSVVLTTPQGTVKPTTVQDPPYLSSISTTPNIEAPQVVTTHYRASSSRSSSSRHSTTSLLTSLRPSTLRPNTHTPTHHMASTRRPSTLSSSPRLQSTQHPSTPRPTTMRPVSQLPSPRQASLVHPSTNTQSTLRSSSYARVNMATVTTTTTPTAAFAYVAKDANYTNHSQSPKDAKLEPVNLPETGSLRDPDVLGRRVFFSIFKNGENYCFILFQMCINISKKRWKTLNRTGGRAIYRPRSPGPHTYFDTGTMETDADACEGEVCLTTFR